MSIYVNNGGVWTLTKDVYVNSDGTWIEPQEVYVNNNGTWLLSHKVVYIAANAINANLFAVVGSPTTAVRLKVIINPGVTIYSSSATIPALTISGFNPGSEILLINNGAIYGAGGNGGSGSTYGVGFVNFPQSGGTAINCGSYVTIRNNGVIAGGGGGGGQSGWGTFSNTTCFPTDTLISTPQGLRPIQDIQIGDEVYAFDAGMRQGLTDSTPIYNSALEVRKVIDTSKHSFTDEGIKPPLVKVTYKGGELIATCNHAVLSSTKHSIDTDPGFTRIDQLTPGDIIYNDNGQEVIVINITFIGEYDYVYNLEVEELHTYIADGIRVHNGGGGGSSKKSTSTTTYTVGGSGGGGGAGIVAGNGGGAGGGGSIAGSAGSAGSASAGGAGGVSSNVSTAGNGGGLGAAGSAGVGGSYLSGGGGAGHYIVGIGYVTFEASGTLIGAVA
jgi:hypothetical protein